jgi:hypothetical protein
MKGGDNVEALILIAIFFSFADGSGGKAGW